MSMGGEATGLTTVRICVSLFPENKPCSIEQTRLSDLSLDNKTGEGGGRDKRKKKKRLRKWRFGDGLQRTGDGRTAGSAYITGCK